MGCETTTVIYHRRNPPVAVNHKTKTRSIPDPPYKRISASHLYRFPLFGVPRARDVRS